MGHTAEVHTREGHVLRLSIIEYLLSLPIGRKLVALRLLASLVVGTSSENLAVEVHLNARILSVSLQLAKYVLHIVHDIREVDEIAILLLLLVLLAMTVCSVVAVLPIATVSVWHLILHIL